jgi:tRNA uridine 5-carboxymethylaminomethyl modification enzyme
LIDDQAWADFQAKQGRAQKLTALLEKTRVSAELLQKIERAQRERSAALNASKAVDLGNESEAAEAVPGNSNGSSLSTAIGSTLAQLLKRPEIVIEDLVSVVRERYPEYFTEIAALAEEINKNSTAGEHKIPPAYSHADESACSLNGLRDDDADGIALSAAARNEMKTVETEIKYAGYLDQQRKSIERLKKAEQRVIPDWFDYAKVSGLSREMNEKLQRVRPRTLGHASRIPGVTPAAVSLINVYIEIQARATLRTNEQRV